MQLDRPALLGRDFDWLSVSALLTVALGAVALSVMSILPFDGLPDPVVSLMSWFAWTFFAISFSVIVYTVGMMRAGNESPTRQLVKNWRASKRRYGMILAGMVLAGLDMYFYMIVKPELNLLFPFWADPYLANFDAWMLGRDGWRFFSSWNLELVSWAYSPFWFFSILLSFYWLLLRPPSIAKSTSIVAYFATWSLFGTAGQALLSSGGPVFYARLGFGERFAQIPIPEMESRISDYLWNSYTQHSLMPGSGISAMPSLHIASMSWMVLSFAAFESRLALPAAALTLFIYAGSIGLGWHYVTDGLVGAIGAALTYYLTRWYFIRREAARSESASAQPLLR